MIEILFTESAAGSMKLAKGIKNIVGSSTAVFIHSEDGAEISPEELETERLRVEEEYRKKREKAIQVEGNPRDVACFPLNLSMGDISEPFSEERAEFLQSTVMIGGPDFSRIDEELMETARKSLERVRVARETVRIWTSRNRYGSPFRKPHIPAAPPPGYRHPSAIRSECGRSRRIHRG